MDIILGAAKEGASLYAVTDPTGITHRVWEVKREDAVAAIRAMLDQAPEPTPADDPTYAAALAGAAQLLADDARTAGTYTGKEPFNFTVAALFPRRTGRRRRAAGSDGFAHPPDRTVLIERKRPVQRLGNSTNKGAGIHAHAFPPPFASSNDVGDPRRNASATRAADPPPRAAQAPARAHNLPA